MTESEYAEARRRMVDGQLRPNRISDPGLLDALGATPREAFVPAAHRARAYADAPVPTAPGRALAAPLAIGRMLQLLLPRPGERALVAGAGTGYAAALLGRIGCVTMALEDVSDLLAIARPALAGIGAVRIVAGDPSLGLPADGPFDLILIEGEVPALPTTLAAQLAPGGRMAGVVAGRAMLGQQLGGTFSVTTAFDLTMPPLPAFRPPPRFTL